MLQQVRVRASCRWLGGRGGEAISPLLMSQHGRQVAGPALPRSYPCSWLRGDPLPHSAIKVSLPVLLIGGAGPAPPSAAAGEGRASSPALMIQAGSSLLTIAGGEGKREGGDLTSPHHKTDKGQGWHFQAHTSGPAHLCPLPPVYCAAQARCVGPALPRRGCLKCLLQSLPVISCSSHTMNCYLQRNIVTDTN